MDALIHLDDVAYIRFASVYRQFKDMLVTPPDPDTYGIYGIENGEESLITHFEQATITP